MNHKTIILTALASLIIANLAIGVPTEAEISGKMAALESQCAPTFQLTVGGLNYTNDAVIEDVDGHVTTYSTTKNGLTFKAEYGFDPKPYWETRVSGTTDNLSSFGIYTQIQGTGGFAIVDKTNPASVFDTPVPIKVNLFWHVLVGSNQNTPGIYNGSDATVILQGPEQTHHWILSAGGGGADDAFSASIPYIWDDEREAYTKEAYISDDTIALTNTVSNISVISRILTHSQNYRLNNAFAWVDPVITIDPSVPNWQNYQIILYDGGLLVDGSASGDPSGVPDTGSTVMLLGMALTAIGGIRSKLS